MSQARVLCIDDDESVARILADIASFCGCAPTIVTDPLEAASRFVNDMEIRVVMTDYMMPKLTGLELLAIWQERRPSVRRVLVTAAPNETEVREALRAGVVQMLISKPPAISDIKTALAWL